MIVVLLIALYTSRIVLLALGVEDFGLFNVVGGVIGLLTFFNGTMIKATQKFLNVAMVKDRDSLASVFASSVTVHILITILFFVLGESIGLWLLRNHMNFPVDRIYAANFVYQATLISFCISILTIPYNAVIVAYEEMTFMAFVSIVDSLLKLFIAYVIMNTECSDRLILYAFLLVLISLVDFLFYFLYCKRHYPKLKFKLLYEKEKIKQMFSYVGWTLVGQFAVVGCNQGNVVLVNMFYPLTVNAAMTIGNQINNAISGLTTNFQTAFNPQITKSFAEGSFDYLKTVVYSTSKISFCILFVVILPVIFNIDIILQLWLKVVPPLSDIFAVLFLVNGILNALSMPFNFIVLSSDNIKKFQLVTAFVFLIDLPATYFLFLIGYPATTVLWVKIFIIIIMLFVRLYFASCIVDTIKIKSYCRTVLAPLALSSSLLLVLGYFLNNYSNNIVLRWFNTTLLEVICLLSLWLICFSREERKSIINYIKNIKKNRYAQSM